MVAVAFIDIAANRGQMRPMQSLVGVYYEVDLMVMLQIRRCLGSNIPVIVTVTNGIMGRDALTDEFKEVGF